MRHAPAGLMLGWIVLWGPGTDARTRLIQPLPGYVKVTVEFRQVSLVLTGETP